MLRDRLQNSQGMRITIRGDNGSGKSILLKLIKKQMGGYYLPASHHLYFSQEDLKKYSTGEQMLICLKEISHNCLKEKILLLDEWDANLDSQNRKRLSEEIEKIAASMCVLEVVHRQDAKA